MSDCPEIQDIRGKVWIVFGEGILYSYNDVYYKCLTPNGNEWHCIWLPTQSQLQEMLGLNFLDLFDEFWHAFLGDDEQMGIPKWAELPIKEWPCFENEGNGDNRAVATLRFTSMEQLWLAFVMKAKYDKVWDGDKWELACPAG